MADGRLAAAGRADQRHRFAFLDGERQIFQHVIFAVLAVLIGKIHVFETDIAAQKRYFHGMIGLAFGLFV